MNSFFSCMFISEQLIFRYSQFYNSTFRIHTQKPLETLCLKGSFLYTVLFKVAVQYLHQRDKISITLCALRMSPYDDSQGSPKYHDHPLLKEAHLSSSWLRTGHCMSLVHLHSHLHMPYLQ